MDSQEEARRKFTFALMVVTAFVGLLAAVGYLSLAFGNDLARTLGIVLMFIPLLLVAVGALYLLWRLNPLAAIATIKQGIDWMTARWQRESQARLPLAWPQPARTPAATTLSPRAARASTPPSGNGRYWVGHGPHQRQLTPEEMVAELERLLPLAAQAGEAQRAAGRSEAALAQLQAQVAEAQAAQRAIVHEQAEALAAQWCQEVLAHWCAVLCASTEVPADPEEGFHMVCVEIGALREAATQAEAQATHSAEVEETLQRRTDDLASTQQHLNTVRQRLDAVREIFGLPTDLPLVEGARQIQAERKRLTRELEEAAQVRQERDALRQQAQIDQDTLRRCQARIAELEALLDQVSRWEELSDADLVAFWGTVNYGEEIMPERWPRRIEQRLRAEAMSLVRLRTERTELARPAGEENEPPSPPPSPLHLLSSASGEDETAQQDTRETEGEGAGPGSSSLSSVPPAQFAQFGVRKQRSVPVRPRRRRPSMGHY